MGASFPAARAGSRVRIFAPVFLVAAIASLTWVFTRPPVYLSVSRVQVDAASGTRPDEKGEPLARLLDTAQSLKGTALLEAVWRKAGTGAAAGPDALRDMLTATPIAGTSVIELRAEGGRREPLPLLLEAWIDEYRRSQAAAYASSSAAAVDEARAAAERLDGEVAAKRSQLEAYRRKFDIVSMEREENQAAARLKGLNAAMNEARSKEVNAEARLNAIRENIAAGRPPLEVSERRNVIDLESRASDMRERMKEMEHDYTADYLALDPKYKGLRANLRRVEQQIEREKATGTRQTLQKAEEELSGARQAAARLQQEMNLRKRDAQDFTTRFTEHSALAGELTRLQEARDSARARLEQLESAQKSAMPRLTVIGQPTLPERPDRPDYWRDAAIAAGGSLALGMLAVWFVEFFRCSGELRAEPAPQPIIHISLPPGLAREPEIAVIGGTATPLLGATAARLPDAAAALPRELSGPEVHAMWTAATPDARLVIAGLLGGLSLDEVGKLRYDGIDSDASAARIPGGRSAKLFEPLRSLLIRRRPGPDAKFALADAHGQPLSAADLEGLIACAACDAGLAQPADVSAEVLRHTYFAYLVRQGARLAELGEFIGRIPPAAFSDYGRLSPPGPGLPLESIDPVFPALRQPQQP